MEMSLVTSLLFFNKWPPQLCSSSRSCQCFWRLYYLFVRTYHFLGGCNVQMFVLLWVVVVVLATSSVFVWCGGTCSCRPGLTIIPRAIYSIRICRCLIAEMMTVGFSDYWFHLPENCFYRQSFSSWVVLRGKERGWAGKVKRWNR